MPEDEPADAPPPPPALGAHEARVLGVLIEKALTTPEQYPLTVNALVAGCNQKSNRDPMLSLHESEALDAIDALRGKGLASLVHTSGGRVDRYRQTAREALDLETSGLAVLSELLCRGPQTPGQLRTRVSRMVRVDDLGSLQKMLDPLEARGFVKQVAPAPGSRAPRFVQLLAAGLHPFEELGAARAERAPRASGAFASGGGAATGAGAADLEGRVRALEAEVRLLRRALEALAGEPAEAVAAGEAADAGEAEEE